MEPNLKNIKDLSVADRPREKLIQLGATGLSDMELIAIILRSGSKTVPLMRTCKSLMDSIGNNIANLDVLNVEQIAKVKGIGEIKAVTLLAAMELGKRSLWPALPLRLKDEKAIENLMRSYFSKKPKHNIT